MSVLHWTDLRTPAEDHPALRSKHAELTKRTSMEEAFYADIALELSFSLNKFFPSFEDQEERKETDVPLEVFLTHCLPEAQPVAPNFDFQLPHPEAVGFFKLIQRQGPEEVQKPLCQLMHRLLKTLDARADHEDPSFEECVPICDPDCEIQLFALAEEWGASLLKLVSPGLLNNCKQK